MYDLFNISLTDDNGNKKEYKGQSGLMELFDFEKPLNGKPFSELARVPATHLTTLIIRSGKVSPEELLQFGTNPHDDKNIEIKKKVDSLVGEFYSKITSNNEAEKLDYVTDYYVNICKYTLNNSKNLLNASRTDMAKFITTCGWCDNMHSIFVKTISPQTENTNEMNINFN